MSLMMISQCNKDLDFNPVALHPTGLPAFSWNYRLLKGFERHEGLVVDLNGTSKDFIEAFHACYPSLTLPELARFYIKVQQLPEPPITEQEWLRFFENYGYRYQSKFSQILHKLIQMPESFQNWVSEKQIGPGDLEPLLATTASLLEPVLIRWSELGFSKSEGVQSLEYLVDLRLTGKEWDELLPALQMSGASYLKYLRRLRYPDTSTRDEEKRMQLMALPWPKQTSAQWLRKGDQGLLEVRFSVSSLDDFHNKISRFSQIEDLLKKSETKLLWKN